MATRRAVSCLRARPLNVVFRKYATVVAQPKIASTCSQSLAHGVAGVPRRPLVHSGGAHLVAGLGDVRSDGPLAALGHEVGRVVARIRAERGAATLSFLRCSKLPAMWVGAASRPWTWTGTTFR